MGNWVIWDLASSERQQRGEVKTSPYWYPAPYCQFLKESRGLWVLRTGPGTKPGMLQSPAACGILRIATASPLQAFMGEQLGPPFDLPVSPHGLRIVASPPARSFPSINNLSDDSGFISIFLRQRGCLPLLPYYFGSGCGENNKTILWQEEL